ncbi:MAG: hypothetical protein HYS98_04600, partial [Deltaproteobacteria bacterium]|nr:hypothetical protein [Deltaproteobacteria bacterium]
ESGQTATEYVLVLAILSLFIIKILGFFREVFLDAMPTLADNIIEEDLRTGTGFGE